ncbi:uncharacterized protein LOC124289201 [Haliotis rubra]|uniref:uncharacterized protein LOC124289201 n=1 Tax=Haliotis rubra TaxID=36100 RepID=UPI001EE5FFCC|nr:uncharacterized protein LOC124289201 [Haliotis rubra]
MADPEAVTEVEASRQGGDQSHTVTDRDVSHDMVMVVGREVALNGATAGAHDRVASIQTFGPPEINDPGILEAMEQLSLSSIPEGARPENVNVVNLIRKMKVSQGTSLGDVDDIPDMVKKKMKLAKDIFVKTEAYRNVYDALENDGHVLISGSPGSGKTTMALYIMGKYRRKKYYVKYVDDVAHFKVERHVNLKVPTLLVLDDVFGRFAPTSEVKVHCTKILDYLETHFKCLEEKRKKRQNDDESKDDKASATPETSLKVIMSSRTNISRHQLVSTMLRKYKTSLFRPSTIADLTISELKEHEKESILRKHLPKARFDLNEHEIKHIASLEYKTLGFPYICQLFADGCSSKDQAVDFFTEPWTYLHDLISDIFTSDDPNYRAAVLLLMVLNDGTLNLIHLQQARKKGGNVELREKIETVEEILPDVGHAHRLNEAARNENRTLLLSEGDRMTFSHPTIYDVVAFVVGDMHPDFILQNCSLKFLIERTKVSEDSISEDPSGGNMHSFMIQLTQEDAGVALVGRLAREIVDGNIALPLSHQCFTLEYMATCLFSKLLSHGNIEQYLHSRGKDHGMGFLYWSSYSSTAPVSKLSFEHTTFSLPEILEGYLGCCLSGNVSSLLILIENSKDRLHEVASITVGDILGITQETRPLVRTLSTACSPTKTEVPPEIETPRSHGDNKDQLIHIATAYGFTAIVELLLDRVGVHIDVRGGNDMTAIMYACYLGHKELAELLLQRQADPELLDEEGDNCLHLACRGGSIDIVKLLLDKTMDIDKHGEHARTPLMYASYNGHGDLVSFLLANGANAVPDVSAIKRKDNCLHLACVKGETEVVRILLDQGGMEIEVIGQRGRTPLMYACRHGWLATAKELVARNAKVNVLDEGSMNCLHLTAIKGNIPVAEWLLGLNVGLTVDCVNAGGRTPLMLAMKHGHTEMADFLMTKGANIAITDDMKTTCLHMAAMSGMSNLLEVCLQNSDVNSLTESGWTPVMGACKGGQVDLVKELVKRGADVNLGGGCLYVACNENSLDLIKYLVSHCQDIDINNRGPKERTALMAACFHGNIEIVEYLLSCGADMTCTDEYKQTCLHVVCRSVNLQLAEKLVRLVPVDDPDENGFTPLMYAVRSDSPELIDLLITNGANINTKDSRGSTYLHSACWRRNVNACAKLLELGMDVDVLDSGNITPLMGLARNEEDCTEVAKFLVERGANIDVRDKDGNTMLHVSAKSDGHPAFAKYLLEKGVDVNVRGAYNHTPVMSACRSGNTAAFDLYLAKGAQLHHRNNHGATCLHLVCMVDTDNTYIVKELLDRDVDINAIDEYKKTPAMFAISKSNVTILRLLLARNASIIAYDKRGNRSTLLHYACSIKDIKTEKIQLLLQEGLRVNETNMYYYQTPLMIAARQGNRAAVDLLLQSRADINAVDRNGRNCVDHAESQGHRELAGYLANRSRRRYHRFVGTTSLLKGTPEMADPEAVTEVEASRHEGGQVFWKRWNNFHCHRFLKIWSKRKMKLAKDIFVKTEAYRNVYDALENDGHVLISGSPGSGKTTMALYIMGKYRRKKYYVKYVDDVAHFKVERHTNLKVPTLLVLDDVFGRFAPTSEVKVHCTKILDYLETHFKCLEEKRKKRQNDDESKDDKASATPETSLKVIMSSRTNISRHQLVSTMLRKYKTSLFRPSTIADLTISELKEHEKESILRKHLPKARFDLSEHEIKHIASLEYKTLGFPYICQLFADGCLSKDQAVVFFTEPWTYLHDLISNIFTADDPNYRAAVLLLMVLNDGTLNLIHLQQARKKGGNVELREKIETVEEILPDVGHAHRLNEAAKNENRTLLLSEGDRMTFSHPTIYDVVAFVVGDMHPDFILQNCSLKFLIERTKVSEDSNSEDPSGGDMHSFMIQLTQEDAGVALVGRLAREIVDGNIALPLSHQCFTLEYMATCLFSKLLSHGNIEQYLHSRDKDHGMGFLYWSSYSSTAPVSKLSFEHTTFSLPEILEGYLGCCLSGNVSSLLILIENSKDRLHEVATITVGDILGITQETRPLVRTLSTACSPTKTEVPPEIETPRSHGDNKDMLIHIAAANGFTGVVELLLDSVETPIDIKGGNGMTALMYSSYLGHKELTELLINRGADPELLDEEGDNCLHLTCRGGSVDIAKSLIAENMDINKHGEHGRTPLMYASYNGHEHIVKLLLGKGALPTHDVSSIDQKDNSLHLACKKGEIRIVQIFLDQAKVDIESRGERARTPLMYACRHGQLETAKELVARHAKANVLDETGFSCLHLAAMKGHVPTAEWLISSDQGIVVDCTNDTGRTPLMYAIRNGHVDMVHFLIAQGSDISVKDDSMVSSLHMAVQSGRWPLMKLCLDEGQDVNACSKSYQTPAMRACRLGDLNLLKRLVEKGANVNLGNGCLYAACIDGSLEIVEYLLSTFPSIDINKCGPQNRSAVMTASFYGHTDVVEYLQSKGADITRRDQYGQTCLHVACRSGHIKTAERLLQTFPIDEKESNGMTPFMYAVKENYFDMAHFLVEHGADINVQNNRGQTSLHTLAWFGNAVGCAKLLDLGMHVDILDSTNRTPSHVCIKELG